MQLDRFANVRLKDGEYSRIGWNSGFFLCQQAGTIKRHNNDGAEKHRIRFHRESFWGISEYFASK
jgi:hypothetical protein